MSVIVYTPGVWDLLHVGHVRFLKAAKALGDKLIVGVASDLAVELDKGETPIILDVMRLEMLMSLDCVDSAIIYNVLDFMPHLRNYQPDILAIGEYWGGDGRHINALEWCRRVESKVITIPYTNTISSTRIKKEIIDRERRKYDTSVEV